MASTSRPSCCGNLDLSQMGSCLYCIGLAAATTTLSWAAVAVVSLYTEWPWVRAALIALSILFSLLLIAHGLGRLGRQRAPGRMKSEEEPLPGPS